MAHTLFPNSIIWAVATSTTRNYSPLLPCGFTSMDLDFFYTTMAWQWLPQRYPTSRCLRRWPRSAPVEHTRWPRKASDKLGFWTSRLRTILEEESLVLRHISFPRDKHGPAILYTTRWYILQARDWTIPLEADVLVSAAVNAGLVRNSSLGPVAGDSKEVRIEVAMRERMARFLFLFFKPAGC